MIDPQATADEAPKILVADDDPAIVGFLADRCARIGFEVQTAANGLQALLMVRQNPPDALIVDINMPEVDGLSVCSRLLSPDRKNIEVVVVTGRSSQEALDRCDSFGAFHIRKGPDLWPNVHAALAELFPKFMSRAEVMAVRPTRRNVRDRPRVLVVDSDFDVATMLGSRLRKCGVDILHAPDAVKGYHLACRERPSVIISEYSTPDGDARYLLWRLRTTPATEGIPVLVTTSRHLDEPTEADLRREVLGRAGAAQLLRKPLNTDLLLAALQKYCAFEHDPVAE